MRVTPDYIKHLVAGLQDLKTELDPICAAANSEKTKADKLKRIEEAAYRWFDGEMSSDRLAEMVFGLINEEASP